MTDSSTLPTPRPSRLPLVGAAFCLVGLAVIALSHTLRNQLNEIAASSTSIEPTGLLRGMLETAVGIERVLNGTTGAPSPADLAQVCTWMIYSGYGLGALLVLVGFVLSVRKSGA